jgi:hypothetical protein
MSAVRISRWNPVPPGMRRSDLCARRKPVARVSCGERTAGLSGRHRHRRDPGPRGYAVQQAACLHSGARTAGWQGSACWACHPPPQTPMKPDMLEAPCDGCGRRMEMAGSCRERAVHALTVTASPGRHDRGLHWSGSVPARDLIDVAAPPAAAGARSPCACPRDGPTSPSG